MAKSDATRLREALDAGDLEAAKSLAQKIERKPAKPRSKRKPARTPPKSSVIITPGDTSPPQPILQPGEFDPSYMATTRGEHVDGVGRTRVEARRVSMSGRQNINIFDDWIKNDGLGADRLDERTSRAEKVLAKNKIQTPRPGMAGAKRPVARKVQVFCLGCGRPFHVYPSEIMMVDSEGGYKCDRCQRSGR